LIPSYPFYEEFLFSSHKTTTKAIHFPLSSHVHSIGIITTFDDKY